LKIPKSFDGYLDELVLLFFGFLGKQSYVDLREVYFSIFFRTCKMYYKLRAQLLTPIMKKGVGVLIWD
jgi:hypothetical protein